MDKRFGWNAVNVFTRHGHRCTITDVTLPVLANDGSVSRVTATGEAIRHTNDKHDAEVAHDLAVGRALESLGRQLQRRAQGRVDMIAHNTAHSEAAKKAKR